MPNELITFGKYKGQPIEVLKQDKSYLDWLSSQDWFREKYKNIYQTIIVNNFTEPSETPEHNSLQVLFLEDNFREKFIKVLEKRYNEKFFNLEIYHLQTKFEYKGIDVLLHIVYDETKQQKDSNSRWIAVEIKPQVGDDYPAVLRQINATRSRIQDQYKKDTNQYGEYQGNEEWTGFYILFLESYTATGATLSQFIKTFELSNIKVIFKHEVDEIKI